MKTSKKTETPAVEYQVKVLWGKEVKEGVVVFNMEVNGITIYDCWYREYTNKEGKEGTMISFPSKKGNDGNYYNNCWFPISKELKESIIEQLAEVVK